MKLTRSRGFSHHTQRDFDQERADLNEGYNNYKQVAEANMNSVLASDEYTLEQKKSYLNCILRRPTAAGAVTNGS